MDGLKQAIIEKIDTDKKKKILEFYKQNKIDAANEGRMETTMFVDRSEEDVIDFYAEKVVKYIEIHSDVKETKPQHIYRINGAELTVDQMLTGLDHLDDGPLDYINRSISISDAMTHAGYMSRFKHS